ncbi:hypothetical protein HMPREF1619_00533 [Klebsiella pneumoniae 909957]|nr:hypothetical protein HMPREF1619_00533 [Klebsiella pneumoniae 909957]UCZ50144.1 hypothetical protein [Klebsiella michiganensis]
MLKSFDDYGFIYFHHVSTHDVCLFFLKHTNNQTPFNITT